jgi:hypothetical protein
MNQLTVGARAFQLREAAIHDERYISFFQCHTNVRRRAAIMQSVIDHGSGQVCSLCLFNRIFQSPGNQYLGSAASQSISNVQRYERLILDDQYRATNERVHWVTPIKLDRS